MEVASLRGEGCAYVVASLRACSPGLLAHRRMGFLGSRKPCGACSPGLLALDLAPETPVATCTHIPASAPRVRVLPRRPLGRGGTALSVSTPTTRRLRMERGCHSFPCGNATGLTLIARVGGPWARYQPAEAGVCVHVATGVSGARSRASSPGEQARRLATPKAHPSPRRACDCQGHSSSCGRVALGSKPRRACDFRTTRSKWRGRARCRDRVTC